MADEQKIPELVRPANAEPSDRVGPGTGDGEDSRPLGDPNAPQGTGPESPTSEAPAPAGEIRKSWAESGDYKS